MQGLVLPPTGVPLADQRARPVLKQYATFIALGFGISWLIWISAHRLGARPGVGEEFLGFGSAGPAVAAIFLSRTARKVFPFSLATRLLWFALLWPMSWVIYLLSDKLCWRRFAGPYANGRRTSQRTGPRNRTLGTCTGERTCDRVDKAKRQRPACERVFPGLRKGRGTCLRPQRTEAGSQGRLLSCWHADAAGNLQSSQQRTGGAAFLKTSNDIRAYCAGAAFGQDFGARANATGASVKLSYWKDDAEPLLTMERRSQ